MRSEFITDVEQQYEVYCKIAEEYGFIDFNAKKNGFQCTTKSNEFNAGWIAWTGAIAAMREDQQARIDELQKRVDAAFRVLSQLNALDDKAHKRWKREACMFSQGESNAYEHAVRLLEQALKGGEDASN